MDDVVYQLHCNHLALCFFVFSLAWSLHVLQPFYKCVYVSEQIVHHRLPSACRHCCHDKCISFSTGQFHFTPSWFKWCDKLQCRACMRSTRTFQNPKSTCFLLPSNGKSIFIAIQNQLVHLFYHSISHFTVLTITCRGRTRIILLNELFVRYFWMSNKSSANGCYRVVVHLCLISYLYLMFVLLRQLHTVCSMQNKYDL